MSGLELEGEVESEGSSEGTACLRSASPSAPSSRQSTARDVLKELQWGGLSLYDHLKHLLELLVATRPRNTIHYFDQFSRAIRDPKGTVRPADRLPFAHKIIRMASSVPRPGFKVRGEEEEEEEDRFPGEKRVQSCLEMAEYFEQMGVGLSKCELYQIDVALRRLCGEEGLRDVRFWGKVYGVDRSYIVAECRLTYEETQARLKAEAMAGQEEAEEEEASLQRPVFGFWGRQEEEQEVVYKKLYHYRMPPLPLPAKPRKTPTKPERTGQGANRKVYYICHEPGEEWVPLPNVKPEEIVAARRLHKVLQGYLNAAVDCFPPFPGLERELLRAQIARISAGTHISPIGYFQFGGQDEMDEAAPEEEEDSLVVNLDFQEIPFQDLLDPAFWVHHTPHILRIGRCTYPEPEPRGGEEMEEEAEGETAPQEAIPPLLTPLSEDVSIQAMAPWRTKGTSALLPASGAVGVFSNLWPGAYAVVRGRRWENLYLGWGQKLAGTGYSPARPPRPQDEYQAGPEVVEAADPSPEMEAEWKQAHRPPSPPAYGEEFGEAEHEGPIYTETSDDD